MTKISMVILIAILIVPSFASASGWSGWLSVQRIDLHPDWKVRVVFNNVIHSDCPGVTTAEWGSSSDVEFMNRVTSSMLAAKASGQEIMLWVSSCSDGIAQVNQTRIQ